MDPKTDEKLKAVINYFAQFSKINEDIQQERRMTKNVVRPTVECERF